MILHLIERLEGMGRQGGAYALSLSILFTGAAAGLALFSLYGVEGVWFPGLLQGAAGLFIAGGLVMGLIGVRLLTMRQYPSAAEVFPPLEREAFKQAVRVREEPVCACTRCRVVIVSTFSTGSCPVCSSSVEYYEVDSDEDAEMVVLAMH